MATSDLVRTQQRPCLPRFQVWNVQPALSAVYEPFMQAAANSSRKGITRELREQSLASKEYYAPEARGERLASFAAKDPTALFGEPGGCSIPRRPPSHSRMLLTFARGVDGRRGITAWDPAGKGRWGRPVDYDSQWTQSLTLFGSIWSQQLSTQQGSSSSRGSCLSLFT